PFLFLEFIFNHIAILDKICYIYFDRHPCMWNFVYGSDHIFSNNFTNTSYWNLMVTVFGIWICSLLLISLNFSFFKSWFIARSYQFFKVFPRDSSASTCSIYL